MKKKIGAVEIKCYTTAVRILGTRQEKNADTLRDLNIGENRFMNTFITQKCGYFDLVKCHSGWERTALGNAVPGRRGMG